MIVCIGSIKLNIVGKLQFNFIHDFNCVSATFKYFIRIRYYTIIIYFTQIKTTSTMQLATPLDVEVFNTQNKLRTNPEGFVNDLTERLQHFNGKSYAPVNGEPATETIEGAIAIRDAIVDLNSRSKGSHLNQLQWSAGLALAARDHCADAGPTGLIGPIGSKGQTPATRVAQYGDAGSALGENLAYGSTQSGYEITMQLLIDDGVGTRTSRKLLFDPRWNYAGISTCAHASKTMMTSIVYSAQDFELNDYGHAKLAENPKPV